MEKKQSWFERFMENRVAPAAAKFGSLRHVVAIRESFLGIISFIVIGAFFMVLRDVPGISNLTAPYAAFLSVGVNLTYGLISVYLAFALSYNLGKSYELNPLTCGLIGTMAFLFVALPRVGDTAPLQFLGVAGMFLAIITSFYAVELYRWTLSRGIHLKAPQGVPPAVAGFFVTLIPQVIILLPLWLVSTVAGVNVGAALFTLFQKAAVLVDSLWGALVMDGILNSWVWFVGIHPFSALVPVYFPFLTNNTLANAAAYAAGKTMPFVQTLAWWAGNKTGGTGSTFPLAIFCLFSRSKRLRMLGRVSLIPALFHINEPLLFGLPLILNPIWLIPFCFIEPILRIGTAYLVTQLGLVAPARVLFMGFLPGPLIWYLGTLDWRAIPWGFVTGWILPALVYYPFWRIYERQVLKEEAQSGQLEQTI